MAYVSHPETTSRMSETAWHVITTIVAVAGMLVAGLGAMIEFAPVNGTITVFDWTWTVADISSLWAPLLMIGGGLAITLAMGWEAIRDWGKEANGWLVGLELLVALAGITAAVIGIVLLF
jgi:hypothetical protein